MGKGMIEKKCTPCLGVGHIEQKEPEVVIPSRLHEQDEACTLKLDEIGGVETITLPYKIAKKPGRKPKQ